MTEIKPPYDELDAIINEYVDNYEFNFDEASHTPSEFEMTLIKDAIYGLLADTDWDNAWGRHIAALAKVEQGEPVAWQCRTRPDWHDQWMGWVDCSKEVFEDYTRVPLLHDWHYEVRELFTHPVRPMSDEEREDAFSRLPNAKSGQFYYYLGIADAEAFHGIKGATE